jgi:16S rRNA (adenine1518-N6/adenine1519-N6)-dimethyltransferase
VDKSAVNRIVARSGVSESDTILEVGPGTGVLTQEFLTRGARVIAVEKDKKLCAYLQDRLAGCARLTLVCGDFLDMDLGTSLFTENPVKVVSNVPYNISSQILLKIIMNSELFPSVYLGLQREVAERIVSRGGSRAYGLLSPLAQLEYDVRVLFLIAPKSFFPSPAVTSAFLGMTRRAQFLREEKEEYLRFLKQSFSQRRKKLVNCLKRSFPERQILPAMKDAGVPKPSRPEQVSPSQFHALFRSLAYNAPR